MVEQTLREDVPQVLGYLETQLPAGGFLFGNISVADVAVATFFRNAAFARFRIDAARWPLTASFIERVLRTRSFAKLLPFEKTLLRTPVAQHRGALAEIGAPLTSDTYGTMDPRRGLMHI